MQPVASLELVTTRVGPLQRISDLVLDKEAVPRAIAVVADRRLLGVLERDSLLHSNPVATAGEIMIQPPEVQAAEPARKVAREFVRNGWDYAAVMEGDDFLGILTVHTLLRELGRSWDPLTGLPWSDRLREWGISRLKDGREVTILFLDIDNFGQYNKKYGHVVGDYVLQLFASRIQRFCDPSTDVLVRYGGDEFVIGTLRTREEAEALAKRITGGLNGLSLEDSTEPVSFSIGIFGGRRRGERTEMHFGSTLDNLINLASRECTLQKQRLQA
jgi:IMP dehydrogenase